MKLEFDSRSCEKRWHFPSAQEDWVMEDETLTSHKEIVDPARIVYKRWGRGIATDMENHPIFCRRGLNEQGLRAVLRIFEVF